jgi:hypothetical protein
MFITIEGQHGDVLYQRKLEGHETLWLTHYVEEWCRENDLRIEHDGTVPLGCGDITATLAEEPGSVCCWNAQSYFVR